MKSNLENGVLTIWLEGRIDSANSEAVEQEINACREAAEHTALILDAENLEYISSAGLRVILRLRKQNEGLRVTNVNSDVYEIFDITGFAEMIHVEKAYRRLSVDGCEIIGQGANGIVYRLDRDTIIKVYRNPDSLPDIQRERELARKAFTLDVPTAIPYDVVRVGNTYGSVFELLNAKPYSQILQEEPGELDHVIEMSVELLKKIHGTEVKPEDMPDMRQVVIGWAEFLKDYLPADKEEKLLALVTAVPEDHHMMHGDYHVKNVMVQNGESLLIDMDTLCQGHPIFELASMYNAYVGFGVIGANTAEDFLGIPTPMAKEFWRRSLKLYLGTEDDAVAAAVEKKAMLIGFTRLMRRDIRRKALEDEKGRTRVEIAKQQILSLLDEVDSLTF